VTSRLDTGSPAASRPALPRTYLLWLAGTRASLLGDAVMYFALGWAASAHGGAMAALVLTAVSFPRMALLLLGGAVGDRFGARRVMVVGDSVMITVALLLAVVSLRLGTPLWLLLVTAAAMGTVDAFYLPATGSMPRRLVGRELLPRALALQQASAQVALLLGAPLGGVLVAAGGLSGAAVADAVTFAVVLVVLVRIRPAFGAERSPRAGSLRGEAVDGVRLAMRDPVLRPALLLTAGAAGSLLPVVSLLNPLLAREHGWGAGVAGLVAGGQSMGMVAVSLLVTRCGALRRVGVGAAAGLCAAALGIAALAAAPVAGVAVAAGIVVGVGSGMFACHIAPLLLTNIPETHLSRVQALVTLVQSTSLLISNNALGVLADTRSATLATAVCAVAVCGTGVVGLVSGPLRHLRQG
jgi:MFS family permease